VIEMPTLDRDEIGPAWDGHLLLLHDTEAGRIAAVTAWARRGLNRGEKVIYVEAADQHSWLFTALDLSGVDVAAATGERRLEVLPVDAFFPAGGHDLVIDRALADGFPAVRMSAEATAALTLLSPEAYLAVEQNVDRITRGRPVSALCQYARPATTGPMLRNTVEVHLAGVRASLATTPHEHGIALHGEIDIDNADLFGEILRAATGTGNRVLWLDLADVSFIDAAAYHRLEQDTADFREAGGNLLLVAPPPSVERILRLLGIDDLPGIALLGGSS
jgi:anti-anti-sigma factor